MTIFLRSKDRLVAPTCECVHLLLASVEVYWVEVAECKQWFRNIDPFFPLEAVPYN